ncbi:MAG: DUF5107 domain-containing protein, partial [Rhodopirellula sp. JB053]
GENGEATVWCHEIDRMHRTEVRYGIRLYPEHAYIEIDAHLTNRTSLPQTFLWWANPAVAVDDNHQSIFPPDVSAMMDHGKRDVSTFPIATGTYYKVDYSEGDDRLGDQTGTDISRYRNIPVPTSYMAYKSDYDFVGTYDHGRQAGLLHVCDHHVSPGKKQWTWGNGDFGQAWDRHLTDEDGPYIELMCGVYTDNQPDFTWLMPGEEKSFRQYFMPYKGIGVIGNATTDAAIGMDVTESRADVRFYTTRRHDCVTVKLQSQGKTIAESSCPSDPNRHIERSFDLPSAIPASELTVTLRDAEGKTLVTWTPPSGPVHEVPAPARAIDAPEQLDSTESLFLAGQHIEQYRHATRRAMDYYDEGLRRDEGDARLNNAKGKLLLRHGQFAKSIGYFERAIERLTRHNPNPYDGEPLYNLGVAQTMLGNDEAAFDAFYKATWNDEWVSASFFELARLATKKGNRQDAINYCQRCLDRNAHHTQAAHLLAYLQRGTAEHAEHLETELQNNAFNFGIQWERAVATDDYATFDSLTRQDPNTVLEIAIDYTAFGQYEAASNILSRLISQSDDKTVPAMIRYHLAHCLEKIGNTDEATAQRRIARSIGTGDVFFANKLEDIAVLQSAMQSADGDPIAAYQLGNLWYDRRQYDDAIDCWEKCVAEDASFATAWRNLSLAYFNQRGEQDRALEAMETAFRLSPNDPRILFELDQLCLRIGESPDERLDRLSNHRDLVNQRDDLYLQLCTLDNLTGHHDSALDLLMHRNFRPWEGGEGKVPAQYVTALVQLAQKASDENNPSQAIDYLERALQWPHNLGEGKLQGIQENEIQYHLGCAYEAMGESAKATQWFNAASEGLSEPSSAMYYNDQPPETIFYQGLAQAKLGNQDEATKRFECLIEYGKRHFNDEVTIDYFAVSLPHFLVFEPDLKQNNQIHCRFMIALGSLGLGRIAEAQQQFSEILSADPAHLGATLHRSRELNKLTKPQGTYAAQASNLLALTRAGRRLTAIIW